MNTIEQITTSLNNLSQVIYKCRIMDGDNPLTGEKYLALINSIKILHDAIAELDRLQKLNTETP